ncbi:MAG: histidine kinase [Betaproteobacteria bacterium]
MTTVPIPPLVSAGPNSILATLRQGFQASWLTVLILVAINTGVAALLKIDDIRPFWHPFISAQVFGLSIAYTVNALAPWGKPNPLRRLIAAVTLGTLMGTLLIIVIKGYAIGEAPYRFNNVAQNTAWFAWTMLGAFMLGLFASLFFLLKFREAHAVAKLHQAEAERHLMSKHAVEAELKLMQAQVEPHFLFNTLASVQYLTETDPRAAGKLLSHLIEYLRAALPQLRASSTTLGKEVGLAAAYLNILKMRMGPRLNFAIDVPSELEKHAFPPNLLISLVENAIKHAIEPAAEGGTIRVAARREGAEVVVDVMDSGRGNAAAAPDQAGNGIGLSNVRERLRALYAEHGKFDLVEQPPHGTRATLSIPFTENA